MPQSIPAPSRRIAVESLNPTTFAPFGTVIENPQSSRSPLRSTLRSTTANQGTATKWADVSAITDNYSQTSSKTPSRITSNLFVCDPRPLRRPRDSFARREGQEPFRALPNAYPTSGAQSSAAVRSEDVGVFDIEVLERHPYTSQTFIPLGLGKEDRGTAYLVIVAPTSISLLGKKLVGVQGPPDLSQIRVFLANGSQAITYAAGTWHAPMAVVGQKAVEFVVVQYMSGVADEDCQECLLEGHGDGNGLEVAFEDPGARGWTLARL